MTSDEISINSIVQAFSNDRWSGAHALALHALKILERVIAHARSLPPREGKMLFLKTAEDLIAGQPAMAIVLNTVSRIENLVRHSKKEWQKAASSAVGELRRQIEEAPERIGTHALRVVPPRSAIMVLSFSSTILHIIKELHSHGKRPSLVVLESRPLLEARRLATAAARMGVPVTLFVDAAVQEAVRRSDVVLFGADAILQDGSLIHKVGSYPVALAAREEKKPVYVACESLKVLQHNDNRLDWRKGRDPSSVWSHPPSGIRPENVLFDHTSARLISGYLTEFGFGKKPLVKAKI